MNIMVQKFGGTSQGGGRQRSRRSGFEPHLNSSFGHRFDQVKHVSRSGPREGRDGIERFFIEDINSPSETNVAQSEIPVMWDKIDLEVSEFNHVPGGGNVLYMDGHVKFVHYPGDFPTSRAWVELVDVMDF